jgi:hypothetical protein
MSQQSENHGEQIKHAKKVREFQEAPLAGLALSVAIGAPLLAPGQIVHWSGPMGVLKESRRRRSRHWPRRSRIVAL